MHVGQSNCLSKVSVGQEFGMVASMASRNEIQAFYIYSYRNDFHKRHFPGAQKSRTSREDVTEQVTLGQGLGR